MLKKITLIFYLAWILLKILCISQHSRSRDGTRLNAGSHGAPNTHHHPLLPLHHSQNILQGDLKTKKHDENDLPADFKKKLTEWEIRKALVGKGQQNVEKLQKNLGEEFNKKMVEWEKMKASGGQRKQPQGCTPESRLGLGSGPETRVPLPPLRTLSMAEEKRVVSPSGTPLALQECDQQQVRIGAGILHLGSGVILSQNALDRKESAYKVKKSKIAKSEKPLVVRSF